MSLRRVAFGTVSSGASTNQDVPSTGIALGAIALAVLVVFAVFIPRLDKGDHAIVGGPVKLADTYPGGYIAATLKDAWANADSSLQSQVDAIVQQVQAEQDYGSKQVATTAGASAVNKIYLRSGNEIYFVQVFASTGGAFSPGEIADPSTAPSGSAIQQLLKVGDGVCVVDATIGSDGTPAVSQSQCQVTKGSHTVQVMSPSQSADKVVAFADEIVKSL